MILILTLLSLCATECRVHRVPNAYEGCTFNLAGPAVCQDPSHWLPCVVVEKCDTVWFRSGRPYIDAFGNLRDSFTDSFSVVDCYPDTLVDSGVVDDDWWFSSPGGKVGILKPVEDDTLWIFDTPFLRSEMPDLKEMLCEWRVEKCVEKARDWDSQWLIYRGDKDAVRDSCECAVEGAKK